MKMQGAVVVLLLVQLCTVFCVNWVPEMENKGVYQGDIILDPDERESSWNVSQHGAYASIKGGRWPGAVVPYVITSSIGQGGRRAIAAAIAQYHKYTCIRWVPRTNQRSYVSFYRGGGCSSPVGYRSGRVNTISLATGCWYTGVTMHEMGHTLGFFHEQSRPDRDRYVRIIWGNIQGGMGFNFNKMTTQTIDSLGTPYDLRSMMHYGGTAFGGGRMTIQTIDPRNQALIGNRKGFSQTDIKQLNLMYKCGGAKATVKPGFTGPQPPACVDQQGFCKAWGNTGYCHGKWMDFMIKNCCKTCSDLSKKFTSAPVTASPSCVDGDRSCPAWARIGECQKNPSWMLVNCKKSCHKC